MQHCLDAATLENDAKVAFFVPTRTLVEQQFKMFAKHLRSGHRCQSISGDEVPDMSLSSVVEVNDVVVMTPQILLNALDGGELASSLCAFTLLIFDECHHTTKHYPYNDIMARYYVDEKLGNGLASLRLPQVRARVRVYTGWPTPSRYKKPVLDQSISGSGFIEYLGIRYSMKPEPEID